MKVLFVGAPLTARSGVYNSGLELIRAGIEQGHDWHLWLGVSANAAGESKLKDYEWATEETVEPRGLGGVFEIRNHIIDANNRVNADLIVSLIPQSDMALAGTRLKWVAFLRGLPWPGEGESSYGRRMIWKRLELIALKRAIDVWATTPLLREEVGLSEEKVVLVPAGIEPAPKNWDGRGKRNKAVWAARFNEDKRPMLFIDAMSETKLSGVMYGSGALLSAIENAVGNVKNVVVGGWASTEELWESASVYVGTSSREAFGRSAVEAAMRGIPIIVASSFGCAPFLITDQRFMSKFVIESSDPGAYAKAIRALAEDEDLRVEYSKHLVENASKLTISASAQQVNSRLEYLVSIGR